MHSHRLCTCLSDDDLRLVLAAILHKRFGVDEPHVRRGRPSDLRRPAETVGPLVVELLPLHEASGEDSLVHVGPSFGPILSVEYDTSAHIELGVAHLEDAREARGHLLRHLEHLDVGGRQRLAHRPLVTAGEDGAHRRAWQRELLVDHGRHHRWEAVEGHHAFNLRRLRAAVAQHRLDKRVGIEGQRVDIWNVRGVIEAVKRKRASSLSLQECNVRGRR